MTSNDANTTNSSTAGTRTKVVWASLVGSMTAVTALLMAVDGDTPSIDGFALPPMVSTSNAVSIESIFDTRQPVEDGRWLSIVVDHTGSHYGTPGSIDEDHRGLGLDGLGYHFVIGNSRGMDDGEVHVGERWLEQRFGAHTAGAEGDRYNRHGIGIALVGNGDQRSFTPAQMTRLIDLLSALSREYGIPPERIVLHSEVAPVTGPGRYFESAAFREQIDSWR